MRALAASLLAFAAAACEPHFASNTYYCGPERFCPPELVCDDSTFSCVEDFQAAPFACPEGSNELEPDDDTASAADPGVLACGDVVTSNLVGCIQGADVDLMRLATGASCGGTDPHVEVRLRYPVATVALTLELLDADGAVLTTGEACTPADNFSGREHLCLELVPEADSTYFVRVRVADGAPDCAGDCAHNQYLLDIAYPLS